VAEQLAIDYEVWLGFAGMAGLLKEVLWVFVVMM